MMEVVVVRDSEIRQNEWWSLKRASAREWKDEAEKSARGGRKEDRAQEELNIWEGMRFMRASIKSFSEHSTNRQAWWSLSLSPSLSFSNTHTCTRSRVSWNQPCLFKLFPLITESHHAFHSSGRALSEYNKLSSPHMEAIHTLACKHSHIHSISHTCTRFPVKYTPQKRKMQDWSFNGVSTHTHPNTAIGITKTRKFCCGFMQISVVAVAVCVFRIF